MTGASFTHTSDGMIFTKKQFFDVQLGDGGGGGFGKERWKDLSKKLIVGYKNFLQYQTTLNLNRMN